MTQREGPLHNPGAALLKACCTHDVEVLGSDGPSPSVADLKVHTD